ncbi:MAG TPA: TerB family tellurite resistance protein [Marinobacter sp.]|nr:TerB family tellurite resistance protein [Marinobacter sp.]
MIERLKNLFSVPETGKKEPDPHELAVAAIALMVQLSRVDSTEDERELQVMMDCAIQAHRLSPEEAESVLKNARSQADKATSLYEFTAQINEHLDQNAKQSLLVNIWRVAFADGRIDKYEEHLIRRIAELLELNHREYILARHRAEVAH